MELLIVVIISILLAGCFILYETDIGKYRLRGNQDSVDNKYIQKLKNDFPDKDINLLKIEIEKISDMLLDNEESNRYTYRIQEQAKNDYRLDEFRDRIADSVEIINYKDGKLKVQVNYPVGKIEYTLIMYMDIVKKGRVFLKKYKSMKRALN